MGLEPKRGTQLFPNVEESIDREAAIVSHQPGNKGRANGNIGQG